MLTKFCLNVLIFVVTFQFCCSYLNSNKVTKRRYSLPQPEIGLLSKISFPQSNPSIIATYFEYWNERRMDDAVALFADDCQYEDTLYPVADALPQSFRFVIDEVSPSIDGKKIGVQWHVESDGKSLPFTRGCSMYVLNSKGLISKGFDVPEPVVKSGSVSLGLLSIVSKILENPALGFVWLSWILYCWLLFVSDLPPGPPAFPLDPSTISDVLNLSQNYWFILPILNPSASPVMHPGLEAIFNFNLAYAALFAGFLVDGHNKNSSINNSIKYDINNDIQSSSSSSSILPVILGMQLLTNAVYLPYLALRKPVKNGDSAPLAYADLSSVERFGESPAVPLFFGAIGVLSIMWAFVGRPEFGDWSQRWESLQTVMSNSLVGSSFIVDIVYFVIFQGWLVDDDMKRRPDVLATNERKTLIQIAKFIPFFGLVYYLLRRPKFL